MQPCVSSRMSRCEQELPQSTPMTDQDTTPISQASTNQCKRQNIRLCVACRDQPQHSRVLATGAGTLDMASQAECCRTLDLRTHSCLMIMTSDRRVRESPQIGACGTACNSEHIPAPYFHSARLYSLGYGFIFASRLRACGRHAVANEEPATHVEF